MHAEDVLSLLAEGKSLADLTPMEILHPPVVVPLTKKVDEMFDFFRENGVRAAVCLNEFGGVEGFITIYDVLSFILATSVVKPEAASSIRNRTSISTKCRAR